MPQAVAFQSFIFQGLTIPLELLVADLDGLPPGGNEVQVSVHEHAVAASVFLIIAAIIEGSIERLRLDLLEITANDSKSCVAHLRDLLSLSGSLLDDEDQAVIQHVEELFAVRNAVAHSHVWRGTIDAESMVWIEQPVLMRDQFGDTRHDRVTAGNVETRILGLNVMPQRIGRRDIVIGIEVMLELWLALRASDPSNMFNNFVNHNYFRFRGQHHRMAQFPPLLRAAWISGT